MAVEFVPQPDGKDCSEKLGGWGVKSTLYEYIWKGDIDESTYPEEACPPRYHGNAQIDNLQVNNSVTVGASCGTASVTNFLGASVTVSGTVAANTGTFSLKPFNIPHPTKEGKRLVHACLEGPENGVYIRGRLTDSNIIELPDYWDGLVDLESITVSLTQIGTSQDLMVKKIEWGKRVVVKSGNASKIDCYYTINATRKDVAPLPVEMNEGDPWPYNP